ncbi:uncharacterized protein LOC130973244 isoform X3 [Arachis stenosperma]|uniref:uncharacterized protein LOC130973244 isoform X3 n=1 Tax=Arachis stenosperma TaxID=217475 RepID=UPI0025AC8053|nr:uncharacterized protein LOC130973244 isoform X3 [Arachis stenosperma]
MREEEPSPNASPPLEELCSSSPPRRGKRSCSLASHRRASWLPMREPREPLPSREGGRARGSPQKSKFYRFDKEGNRWKERTYGTVKFPKNKYKVSIGAACNLSWPAGCLVIQVLDDLYGPRG